MTRTLALLTLASAPSRLASLPSRWWCRAHAAVESAVYLHGVLAYLVRFGMPYWVGLQVCFAIVAPLPTWVRVVLLLLAAVVAYVCSVLLHYDESDRLADQQVLDMYLAECADKDARIRSQDKRVAQYDRYARYCERRFLKELDRAAYNAQIAIFWRSRALQSERKAQESEYILQQSVDGYADMSAVVMGHLFRLGGDEAVAAAGADLRKLEHGKN